MGLPWKGYYPDEDGIGWWVLLGGNLTISRWNLSATGRNLTLTRRNLTPTGRNLTPSRRNLAPELPFV